MHIIKEAPDKFYIGEAPDNILAWIDYQMYGRVMSILHTEVSEALQGQGAGQQLVAYAVDYARRNDLKIDPVCPYARSQFGKNSKYWDVLDLYAANSMGG